MSTFSLDVFLVTRIVGGGSWHGSHGRINVRGRLCGIFLSASLELRLLTTLPRCLLLPPQLLIVGSSHNSDLAWIETTSRAQRASQRRKPPGLLNQ
jgi:hypothetical protein